MEKQQLFNVMGDIFQQARKILDAEFKNFALSRPEWLLLAMLRLNPDNLTQAKALKYIGVEKSYFSKMLNKLEDKGFISREVDKNNRRNRLIKVNPKASKEVKKIFKIIADFTDDIQQDLTATEISNLYKTLSKIQNRLSIYKP